MFQGLDSKGRRQAILIILVAALGYFVDIFDLLLFGMVRVSSLQALGVAPGDMLEKGGRLISMQMTGMLVGGVLWGVMGDKRGRLSVLFGSILIYSIANLANAWVTTVDQYAFWRFMAGLGLAGELGAGITLVAEVMPKESRGIGTSVVAGVGILGACVAYMISTRMDWRHAYMVGGCLGLVLLVLRVGVSESGLFSRLKGQHGSRGDLFLLFRPWLRLKRYLAVIALGVPLWYMVGILVTFSPEMAAAAGLNEGVAAGKAIAFTYLGLAIGDLASGFVSQALRSRRKAVLAYLLLQMAAIGAYFLVGLHSLAAFYPVCFVMGLGGGFWALFVTIGAEQFGTDIRATVATTVPNFVRGAVTPMVAAFLWLKVALSGVVPAALAVGGVVFLLAFLGLASVEETYTKDLDYTETA